MATAPLPFLPNKKTTEGLLEYCKQTIETAKLLPLKQRFEYIDTEFYRTNLLTTDGQQAQLANRIGDKKKIADVVMPVVEPQIETSLSFLSSVFLSGFPMFGVVSPSVDAMPQAKVLEAKIAEDQVEGGWIAEFLKFFRDGLKYNFHGIEISWDKKTIYSPIRDVTPNGLSTKTKDVLWEGNCIKRIDPYNCFFDVRVAPHKVHECGEFAGYVELYGRVALKQFLQDLPTRINVAEALKSSAPAENGYLYYIPKVNPWENYSREKLQVVMNWDSWAGLNATSGRLDYKNLYEVVTRYVRIIPSDFGLPVPAPNQPQIWKIITVNDSVIVYCERQTNAHNFFPIVLGQPFDDGLGMQSKGLGEKMIPLQDLGSAAWNARLSAQRRKISDRGLYDPSRVRESDINSDNPSAKIPVKSSAYGKSLSEAYHPIPFEDMSSGSYVSDAQEFQQFSNLVSGQNPAMQGQFVKGNKTKVEFQDIQGRSSGRQQTQAIFIEAQTMTPVKKIIKLNILQYQPDGPIVNPVDGQSYEFKAQTLRELDLKFKVSDGLVPADKIIDNDILQVAIQALGSIPELQTEWDIGSIINYLLQLRGNIDFSQFRRTPEQIKQLLLNTALKTKASGQAPAQPQAAK